jgi:hypothetical protein
MHAYPFYIIAAVGVPAAIWRAVAAWRRERMHWPFGPSWRNATLAAAVLAAAAAVAAGYLALPWLVVRESIGRGEDVNIETGPRDAIFYRSGWSRPHLDGVVVRVSRAERSRVAIPLPVRAPYDLVLRVDPVVADVQQRLAVLFNGQLVARFQLGWDPERFGSYRLHLQPHQVRPGRNELTLVPDALVPAASAGPRFAWVPREDRIGIRLWYVRVLASTE